MAELTLEQRKALARARARARAQQSQQSTESDDGWVQTGIDALGAAGRGALRGAQLGAEGASQGIMDLIQLPGAALNQAPRLANLVPGVDGVGPIVEDYNPAMELGERMGLVGVTEPENKLEEYVLQGGRAAGGALAGGGALSLGMRGAQGTSMLGRGGREMADAFARRPALFVGTDATGGFGAAGGGDAGQGIAEWLGTGETGQQVGRGIGTLLGGVGGGTIPAAGPAAARRTKDYVSQQFFPFTKKGSRLRASHQLQSQAADLDKDPEARRLIEEAAVRAENAPEGVTPARATRKPGLIAQENRLAEDIPTLGRKLRDKSTSTQVDAEAGIRGAAGQPQSKPEWTRNLIQRVAAPGAEIRPGDTDDMIRQGYNSFGAAYRDFDGYPVNGATLGKRVDRAIKDAELPVGTDARKAARAFMKSQLGGLAKKAPKDSAVVQSEDFLAMRQNVRHRLRDLQGDQSDPAQETRRVLSRVERELTDYLDQSLPAEVRNEMKNVDNQYRQFKRIEEAAYRGGEGELDPKKVLDSIRRRSDQGGYTRGEQEALRRQVIQGLDGEDLIKDRDLLTKAVRGASAEQRKPVQAKLLETLANRSRLAPDDEGVRLLSGQRMREQLRSNREALKASGMSDGDISRMDKLAQKIVDVQRKTPEEIATIFTDGPNSLAELGVAIAGARAGQNLAGGGIGASIVLANFMSNRSRKLLATAFGEHATEMLEAAALDPKLYASLLRTRNASLPKQREAAATIEAWLIQNIADGVEAPPKDPEGPRFTNQPRPREIGQRPGPPTQ